MTRNIHALHTPTFEVTTDEAFETYVRMSTTTSVYSLTAKGRGGKPSLRAGGTIANGFGLDFSGLTSLGLPGMSFRASFDIHIDTNANTNAAPIFTLTNRGGAGPGNTNASYDYNVDILSNGTLAIRCPGSPTTANSGKALARNTIYNVEVECVISHIATEAYGKVWVDGELVLDQTGTNCNSSSTRGVRACRWSAPVSNSGVGSHVSNILVYDDEATLGTPLGVLDFAYVPVQDGDLGETRTDDASSFETFSDAVFRDFPLAADARTGAIVGVVPSVRVRPSTENPTTLDMRLDGQTVFGKRSVSPGWANVFGLPFVPGAAPGTISLRNSPT